MLQLTTSIAAYLQKTRLLIYGVGKNDFIKERVLPFNIDDAALDAMKVIYTKAKESESSKLKEHGEQLEASELFNNASKKQLAISAFLSRC